MRPRAYDQTKKALTYDAWVAALSELLDARTPLSAHDLNAAGIDLDRLYRKGKTPAEAHRIIVGEVTK